MQRVGGDVNTQVYGTIQNAIDAIGATSGANDAPRADGSIEIYPADEAYTGPVVVDTAHLDIEAFGQATELQSDSSVNLLSIETNDVFISDLAVDHTGTGSNDAVYSDSGTDETQLFRVSVDNAPRYGFNINASFSHLLACEGTGGGTAALKLSGDRSQAHNFKAQSPTADGVLIDGNSCTFDGVIFDAGDYGMTLNGVSCRVDASIAASDSDGLLIGGIGGHIVNAIVTTSTDDDVVISSDGNFVMVRAQQTVVIESGAEDNVVMGYAGSSLTDNGTNNNTDNLLVP
ncbi:hypothetical protein [Halobacterium salinarum]|uniref:hypothetical protein n=1 Tax=Halobacterium salinarum TaxID=2242 RepID=UPI002553CB83|nr:hypothetical protein [Halobacterium salinarum]MDL0135080.1 hypothetical protein [Halobacterium salinarum]